MALLTRRTLWGAVALAGLLLPAPAAAQTLTQDQALALAFPDADEVRRATAYLDDAQLAAARELAGAGVEVESGVVTYYLASAGGSPLGVAYFDVHRVRTLPQVLMVVVTPEGRIRRMEVVRFSEPPEYRAPDGWLRQFDGKDLSADLSHKRGVANITGATLTSRATTAAARRVLALHQVIAPLSSNASGGAR